MALSTLDEKYASIDVGLKRIGFCIAISGITLPQKPIFRKNRDQAQRDLDALLQKHNITILVVGMPFGDSEIGMTMRKRIKHFVGLLTFDKPIYFEDEDFSSFEAKELSQGVMRQKKDGKIDSLSAKIILDRFLDKHLKSL